jgi:hypothetical protein
MIGIGGGVAGVAVVAGVVIAVLVVRRKKGNSLIEDAVEEALEPPIEKPAVANFQTNLAGCEYANPENESDINAE